MNTNIQIESIYATGYLNLISQTMKDMKHNRLQILAGGTRRWRWKKRTPGGLTSGLPAGRLAPVLAFTIFRLLPPRVIR